MWSVSFWKATAERAAKTFAQTFLAALGGSQFNLIDADIKAALCLALGATVLSVVTSLASAKVTNGDPSLV